LVKTILGFGGILAAKVGKLPQGTRGNWLVPG